jgi:hypothetical protein
MRLSRLLSKHSADAANIQESNSAQSFLIYMQRFGRYEFSNGRLQFEILARKVPQITNDGK